MSSVAIAGASGFVGSKLRKYLQEKWDVVSLGRATHDAGWRACDLFSLLQTENALEGIDFAVYLVHSMLPSSELTQGSFQDMDLLIAENFAQAAKKAGVKQIVYLGGIIPDDEKLSTHLESRLEVEKALASTTVPLTSLRAAMVLGPGGSSMNMMVSLVEKLPVMICPSWTSVETKPIFIDDVVSYIDYCIGREECYSQSFDIGGPDLVSYRVMMEAVAEIKGLKRQIFPVPVFTPKLSRLWVSTVTGAPKNLVLPLIESLRHRMVPSPGRELIPFELTLFREALELSCKPVPEKIQPRAYQLPAAEKKARTVLSVQRLHKPESMSAKDVAREYLNWLPKQMRPLLKIETESDWVSFKLLPFGLTLLKLEYSEERSSPERSLFYIRGGVLNGQHDEGRLEFRSTFDRKFILAALHDFHPTLPWYVYKYTQAIAHLWVMSSFGKHLKRLPASVEGGFAGA